MLTLSEGKASSSRKIVDFVRFTQILEMFSISYAFYHYHLSSAHFSQLDFHFDILEMTGYEY